MTQFLNAVWKRLHPALSYRLRADRQAGSRSIDPRLPPLFPRSLSLCCPGECPVRLGGPSVVGSRCCSVFYPGFIPVVVAVAQTPSLGLSIWGTLRRRTGTALGGVRQCVCVIPSNVGSRDFSQLSRYLRRLVHLCVISGQSRLDMASGFNI